MELKAKVYTRTNDSKTQYARIVAPKEIRAFISKPAIWKSLSTKDKNEASAACLLVAAGTQLVFQEVADEFAAAAVVKVETEIIGKKFDIAAELDKLSQEDITIIVAELRKKFGIKGDTTPRKKSNAKRGTTGTKGTEASKADDSKKLEISDAEVEHFIEKRHHGVYRFRYWVSNKLQKKFGQREVRKTLKTSNKKDAIRKARPILESVLLQIQQISTVA